MNKTICFFSAQYLPHLGGVERYTYNLAKKLIKMGYHIIVVTSQAGDLKSIETVEGIDIYRMDSRFFMGDRFPLLKKTKTNKEIENRIQRYNIVQVIVNTRFYPLSVFGLAFAKKQEIPSILIEHSTGHIKFNNELVNKMGEVYDHWMTNRIKKMTPSFYGVSQACNHWLKHFNIEATGVLYNAIDLSHIKSIIKDGEEKYRNAYGIDENEKVICFTGRLIREKGVLELLEAMDKLVAEFPNVHLFVAGDGPLYEELQQKKIPNTYILGRLEFQDIVILLEETDIFCFPTNYPEGFPTSVIEAAASHCYIITTDRGGSKELVKDEEYGTLLEEGKNSYIYQALKRVLRDPDGMKQATAKAYQRVIDTFIWEKTAEKIHKIITRQEDI